MTRYAIVYSKRDRDVEHVLEDHTGGVATWSNKASATRTASVLERDRGYRTEVVTYKRARRPHERED